MRMHGLRVVVALLLSLCLTQPVAAQILADGQRMHPVRADRHMVVAQEARAAEIGRQILRDGGNAVDAAVAVGFALAVTLPRAGNIGGGGFMVLHDADTGKDLTIDFRERAPAAATRDMFLDAEGNADPTLSRSSGLAVGVPGTVAGLAHAHANYGSGTLSWSDLLAPAIALARDGMVVHRSLADTLGSMRIRGRLMNDPASLAVFYPGGNAPAHASTLVQADLADTLERIANEGSAGFYEGPVAEAIVATLEARGGNMTLEDLANYAPVEREPIIGTFKDYEIVSMPPPSSGGVHLVQMLNTLENAHFGTFGLNSAAMIHHMAEAAKFAYADRSFYLGDPDFVDIPVAALTSKAYAAELAARIDPDRATPSSEIAPDPGALPQESEETTHFSVLDADGNAVSVTYTLNFSYGVGFMAAGTGVLLNNELDDFSAKPGVPNAYGLVGGEANAVAANKRPLSSMTPTLVKRDGNVIMVTGSPGGSRIITTVLQIILNATVHERDIMTATTSPRVHHQWLPDYIRVEEGISFDTIRLLEEKGHEVKVQRAMGSTQSIMVQPDGLITGASDTRTDGGLAAGD